MYTAARSSRTSTMRMPSASSPSNRHDVAAAQGEHAVDATRLEEARDERGVLRESRSECSWLGDGHGWDTTSTPMNSDFRIHQGIRDEL